MIHDFDGKDRWCKSCQFMEEKQSISNYPNIIPYQLINVFKFLHSSRTGCDLSRFKKNIMIDKFCNVKLFDLASRYMPESEPYQMTGTTGPYDIWRLKYILVTIMIYVRMSIV